MLFVVIQWSVTQPSCSARSTLINDLANAPEDDPVSHSRKFEAILRKTNDPFKSLE